MNADLMKSFLTHLVSMMNIDGGSTRVAVVTYSSTVGPCIKLNEYSTVASLQSAISLLPYSPESQYSNTAAAFEYVRTWVLIASEGDRIAVPNVVVLLTAGQSTDIAATQVCLKHLA